jgi:hypothetical protein
MSYKSPLSIRDKLYKKKDYIGEYMLIHPLLQHVSHSYISPMIEPFYCNNILMFSFKLVLVCDQVLI